MNNTTRQTDFFPPAQPDLFERQEMPPIADEARMRAMVRPRLAALLAEARAAERMPWDPQRAAVNEVIFHSMANWLPPDERETIRQAFKLELDRLKDVL